MNQSTTSAFILSSGGEGTEGGVGAAAESHFFAALSRKRIASRRPCAVMNVVATRRCATALPQYP